MIRAVLTVSGILLAMPVWAASQDAASPQDALRQQHRPMTRAERLALINNNRNNRPIPDQPTATSNPTPPLPSPTAQPASTAPPAAAAHPPAAAQPAGTPNAAADPPPTDQPPTPPQVTYRNGLLTVQAVNSTLAGVLTAIRNKTGIQFEGLEGGSERVAVVMGPAPEGEVLAAILSGSQFDFVALERPDSPGIVQRVILTRRAGSAPVATAPGSNVPARTSQGDDEGDTPDEQAAGDPDAPQDTPARPPVLQAQPQQQPQPDPQPKQAPTQEQLYQELLRMQQQRQQQQQQQQPPEPNHGRQTPP